MLLLSNPSDCTAKNNTGVLGTRPVLKSQAVGSPNKTYTTFDDLKLLADSAFTVHSIVIAAFYQVDSLQFTYTLKDGSIYRPPERGEGFTTPYTILLAKDEYIPLIEGTTAIEMTPSARYSSPLANKYKSRVYSPYGAYVGEQSFTFKGYILGIQGKTGPSLIQPGNYPKPRRVLPSSNKSRLKISATRHHIVRLGFTKDQTSYSLLWLRSARYPFVTGIAWTPYSYM